MFLLFLAWIQDSILCRICQHSFPFFRLSMCISSIINNISSIFCAFCTFVINYFYHCTIYLRFFTSLPKKCLYYIALHFRIVVFLYFSFYKQSIFSLYSHILIIFCIYDRIYLVRRLYHFSVPFIFKGLEMKRNYETC